MRERVGEEMGGARYGLECRAKEESVLLRVMAAWDADKGYILLLS